MAKNNNPSDYDGSSGEDRSYYDPSLRKRVRSRKGGPSGGQFMSNPNYTRARERASEFGGCSKWSSLLKMSFRDIGHLMHVRCFNKIMAGGRLIQEKDENGVHGFRSISVINNPMALEMIDFNQWHPFPGVLRANYETTLSEDKSTVTLEIPGFIPSRDARWDKNYTTVRIYLVIAQLSDMVWDKVNKTYLPLVPDLELRSKCTVSEWMVKNFLPVDLSLVASFEEPALTSPGSAVLVALGVEFSTSSFMGQPYVTPGSGSAAIVGCFTS
jgi:hypothetical protein